MNKFGFDEKLIETWQDCEIFLKGKKDTAVVLVHGWSAFPKQMSGMLQAINENGYTVLAPLLKGHGSIPEDLECATANDWVANVVEAIQRLRKQGHRKILVGGISMGGNVSLLASLKTQVEGIVLIGTPVHLKNHLWVWAGSFLVPIFTKYYRKKYPKSLDSYGLETTSYQYYPVSSVRECLNVIRSSVLSLGKITAPILVLQTNKDYLVSKYSPWVIYNCVRSKTKKMQWIKTKDNSHVLNEDEEKYSMHLIMDFLEEIEKNNVETK